MEIDGLLSPLSEEAPTGEDLEYDPEFGELERTAAGTPAQVMGDHETEAIPPDWKAVRDIAVSLFERSRDLRVGVYLTGALLNTKGFQGLRDGLELIHGLSENFWDTVHPQLDEDDGDPLIRCNAVRELVNRDKILNGVLNAPFVVSRVAGRYGLRDVKIAGGELSVPDGDDRPAPKMDIIEAAFREVDSTELEATQATVAQCSDLVKQISALYDERTGADAPDLSALQTSLDEISGFMTRQLGRLGIGEAAAEDESWDAPADGGVGAGGAISGEIRNSEDVLRMIDKICFYYQQREPSSPVPILLRRAAGLVNKNFFDLVADLAPSGVSEAHMFGPHDGYDGSSASSSGGWGSSEPEEAPPAAEDSEESWG